MVPLTILHDPSPPEAPGMKDWHFAQRLSPFGLS